MPPGINLENIPNIYAYHTLLSWAEDDVDPQELTRLTLADFLSDQPQKEDKYGFLRPRILIFDQFEELFTAYPDRWHDGPDGLGLASGGSDATVRIWEVRTTYKVE